MEAHAPRVAHDDGADLQELETDGAGLGAGHLGAGQPETPDGLDQRIGEAGEQQAAAVEPPLVARGAVGEQVQLLLLDAVLHVAARAIELLVEILRIAFQVGDDVAELLSKVDGAVKSRFLMRVGWVIIVHVYFTRPTDRRIV